MILFCRFSLPHAVILWEVIENKYLSATMDSILEKQRQRVEETIAKPSTTLREARLLRAGTPRRTAPSAPLENPP